jgi:hypothetical protein
MGGEKDEDEKEEQRDTAEDLPSDMPILIVDLPGHGDGPED